MNEELLIEGRKVKITNIIQARTSNYTVYNDKIWKIVGREGLGKNRCITLEREEHKEVIYVKGMIKLPLVLSPSGYISGI